MNKANTEASELSYEIERLTRKFNFESGVDQMIASDLLDLAKALHADLQEIRARLDRLEQKKQPDISKVVVGLRCTCQRCAYKLKREHEQS